MQDLAGGLLQVESLQLAVFVDLDGESLALSELN